MQRRKLFEMIGLAAVAAPLVSMAGAQEPAASAEIATLIQEKWHRGEGYAYDWTPGLLTVGGNTFIAADTANDRATVFGSATYVAPDNGSSRLAANASGVTIGDHLKVVINGQPFFVPYGA